MREEQLYLDCVGSWILSDHLGWVNNQNCLLPHGGSKHLTHFSKSLLVSRCLYAASGLFYGRCVWIKLSHVWDYCLFTQFTQFRFRQSVRIQFQFNSSRCSLHQDSIHDSIQASLFHLNSVHNSMQISNLHFKSIYQGQCNSLRMGNWLNPSSIATYSIIMCFLLFYNTLSSFW